MISRTPGWSWTVAGGAVTLAPRGDVHCGRVRYRERVQPLRTVEDILGARIADGTIEPIEVGAIEALTTDEGEYAAVVRARGRDSERTIGVVLADDWYAEIDALALRADQFERFAKLTRSLVRQDRLMLGVRRRRVRHDALAGWHHDEPLPMFARYRRGAETAVVYAAMPVPAGVAESFDLLVGGPPAPASILRTITRRTPIIVGELAGSVWELEISDEHARRLARRIALLRDDRYLYTAYVDVPFAELAARRAMFDALLASIEPIPFPARSSDPELFEGLF